MNELMQICILYSHVFCVCLQELNLPHQVLGIVVCAAVAANVSALLSPPLTPPLPIYTLLSPAALSGHHTL